MRIHLGMAVVILGFAGCQKSEKAIAQADPPTTQVTDEPKRDDVMEERAKLNPTDRALVDAQEWCAISKDGRLGSMGAPIMLTIEDQTVFVCCKGCKKKAESDPDKTLAKVEELKARAKAEKDSSK